MAGSVKNSLFASERMHPQGSSATATATEGIETGPPPADRSRGEFLQEQVSNEDSPALRSQERVLELASGSHGIQAGSEMVSNEDSPALRSQERVTIAENHGDVLELVSGSHGIQAGSEMHPTFHEPNLNLTNRSTGREVGVVGPTRNGTPNEIQPQRTARDDAEATKCALMVAYLTIPIAATGIITIICELADERLKHAYSLHLKICVVFLLVSFVSGAWLMILHFGSLHMRIVTTLETTTVGALVLAVLYVAVAFLTVVA